MCDGIRVTPPGSSYDFRRTVRADGLLYTQALAKNSSPTRAFCGSLPSTAVLPSRIGPTASTTNWASYWVLFSLPKFWSESWLSASL